MEIEDLKYPIGKYNPEKNPSDNTISKWINEIERFPLEVKNLIQNSPNADLGWVYRPNGWSISQVIHHCADSHMNSLIRFKLALTENSPTIRPYFEDRWAELSDSKSIDVSESILLLDGLHRKWVKLLRSLNEDQLQYCFIHPEQIEKISLAENIGIYAWHCRHHLSHIKNGIEANGKFNTLEE